MISLVGRALVLCASLVAGNAFSKHLAEYKLGQLQKGLTTGTESIAVVPLFDGRTPDWAKAIQGDAKPGSFNLRAFGAAVAQERVDYDLRLADRGNVFEVLKCQLKQCDIALSYPKALVPKREFFTANGQTWGIEFFSPTICNQGQKDCSIGINSRSLVNLRRKDGLSALSAKLMVLQSPNQLVVADYNSRNLVSMVSTQELPVNKFGKLRGVQSNGAGQIVIQVGSAAMVLDFVLDQVLLFTGSSKFRAPIGAGLDLSVEEERLGDPDQGSGGSLKVLGLTAQFLLTASHLHWIANGQTESLPQGWNFVGNQQQPNDGAFSFVKRQPGGPLYLVDYGQSEAETRLDLPKEDQWLLIGGESFAAKNGGLLYCDDQGYKEPSFGRKKVVGVQGRFVLTQYQDKGQIHGKVAGQKASFQELGPALETSNQVVLLGSGPNEVCALSQPITALVSASKVALLCMTVK